MIRLFALALAAVLLLSACVSPSPPPRRVAVQPSADQRNAYDLVNRVNQLERELRELRGQVERLQYRGPGGISQSVSPNADRFPGGSETAGLPPAVDRRPLPPVASRPGVDSSAFPIRSEQQIGVAPAVGDSAGIADRPALPRPGGNATNTVTSPGTSTSTRQSGLPRAAEQGAYNAALDNLREGHNTAAITQFRSFINANPNSSLLGDAHYWLGEAHYVDRNFNEAKQAYLTLGAQYPDSEKLPDALLKLGYIYTELGDNQRARQVLGKLIEAFPGTGAANLAQSHLQRI